MSVRTRCVGAVAAVFLLLLSGCSGFFPPLSDSSGGGSDTTTGSFVYVANAATSNIGAFAVGTSSAGAATLTAISGSPYGLTAQPTALAITPGNSYLYVAEAGGIYGFSINSSTGALTGLDGSSILAITTLGSVSLDVSPDGQWLFALSQDSATLNWYKIGSDGSLTLQDFVSYAGANGTQAVAKMVKVAPSGNFVFIAMGTGGDADFAFTTSTGVMNKNETSLATGSTTTGDNALAIDSTSSYLYIARSGGTTGIAVYTISSDGSLHSISGSPFASGNGPAWVTFDTTGKYLYAANRADSTISGYSIGTGGVLTALAGSPFASGNAVNSLAADKSGSYMLASAGGGADDLTMYGFSSTSAGALSSVATAATGTDPTQAVMVVATH
ncbi:MAG TPA: beta-propeller fold lactonase family protein [Granulicella sp.]